MTRIVSEAAAVASLTTPRAASGRSQHDASPASQYPPAGSAHTLHVEYAVWSDSYRIIHTRPDGKRSVWRRGIPTAAEALLRARYVAELTGYHVHTPTGKIGA